MTIHFFEKTLEGGFKITNDKVLLTEEGCMSLGY